jgi:hypothetical protein
MGLTEKQDALSCENSYDSPFYYRACYPLSIGRLVRAGGYGFFRQASVTNGSVTGTTGFAPGFASGGC